MSPTDLPTHLIHRLSRVQELCQALTGPAIKRGEQFAVIFEDGTSANISDVLEQGRAALGDVADLFGTTAAAPDGQMQAEATNHAR